MLPAENAAICARSPCGTAALVSSSVPTGVDARAPRPGERVMAPHGVLVAACLMQGGSSSRSRVVNLVNFHTLHRKARLRTRASLYGRKAGNLTKFTTRREGLPVGTADNRHFGSIAGKWRVMPLAASR
jgi:hypothetical protein